MKTPLSRINLSPRDRRAIGVGSVVLAVALLGFYVVGPGIEQWRTVRASAERHEASLADLEARLDRRDAVLRRLEDKYGPAVHQPLEDVETLRTRFPEQMQALLGSAGVGFQSIELQAVQKLRDAPGLVLVSVRVQGTSNPNAVAKLLAAAAAGEHLVLVDRLQLTRKDRPDQWAVSLTLSTPAREGGRS